MTLDSSTLCARTAAGDAELALPALGLSLGQRRVLTLLRDPSAVDEFAQKHHLEPARLERDLTRLSDLRLVVLQGAAVPAPSPKAASMAPVVIGGSTRRAPAKAFAAGATALLLAVGIWYGTRSHDPEGRPHPAAVIATLAPITAAPSETPAPQVSRTANDTASSIGVPATAMVLRSNAVTPERRAEIRPGLGPLTVNPTVPAGGPGAAQGVAPGVANSAAAPIATPTIATIAAPNAAPVARPVNANAPRAESVATTGTAAPPIANSAPSPSAPMPATAAPAVVDPPAPLQLAAANPSPAPRTAAPAPLKSISRDPPEFPKEAVADGLKSGLVTARLHVDARGRVTGVDILGAQPPRVFDRAVRRALLQWQFEPPATGGSADVDVDVKFQRD